MAIDIEAAMDLLRRGTRHSLDERGGADVALRQQTEAYRAALHLALEAVAASGRASELMLRGSALMSTWYPAEAREPGDLDFVVVGDGWEIGDSATDAFFERLVAVAADQSARSRSGEVRIDAGNARTEGIWEYDRAPGRRLTMPWLLDGIPGGSVQLDFVFGEKVRLEPEAALITLAADRPGVPLRIAPKPLSLAWKLSWLLVDFEPKPKDLYDAVLLAEDDSLDRPVLRRTLLEVFQDLGGENLSDLTDLDLYDTWGGFQQEHPRAQGSAAEWLERLMTALKRA